MGKDTRNQEVPLLQWPRLDPLPAATGGSLQKTQAVSLTVQHLQQHKPLLPGRASVFHLLRSWTSFPVRIYAGRMSCLGRAVRDTCQTLTDQAMQDLSDRAHVARLLLMCNHRSAAQT